MKLVKWEFMSLCVPMMEDDAGELYCTSKAIISSLGMTEDQIRRTVSDHKEEFSSLSVRNTHANDFLRRNKAEFNVQRVRDDMRMWSEDDMLTFAFHSKSSKSLEFRKQLRVFIKQHATKNYVTKAHYNQMEQRHAEELASVHQKLDNVMTYVIQTLPINEKSASLAGTVLRGRRDAKVMEETLMN